MTALTFSPARSLVASDLLKLGRRRGLVAVTSLLTVGAVIITYGVIEALHLADAAKHGPAGGIDNLGHGSFVVVALGAVAAAVVGASAAVGDLESGVYRDLVVTGRSRLALCWSRLRGGLLFLLPFVAAAYALAAVSSVVFAGGNPAPGTALLVDTGLWALLQATFYYLLAFGLAALIGSRSYTIGVLLAFRLALTPILATISALGIVRELVPGVALMALAPTGLGDSVRQGPPVPMSVGAIAAVLAVWAAAALAAGAWRDVSRDV
jgi:ABC-type transport system involved in multi-copper enzyme maturation permease subunit